MKQDCLQFGMGVKKTVAECSLMSCSMSSQLEMMRGWGTPELTNVATISRTIRWIMSDGVQIEDGCQSHFWDRLTMAFSALPE